MDLGQLAKEREARARNRATSPMPNPWQSTSNSAARTPNRKKVEKSGAALTKAHRSIRVAHSLGLLICLFGILLLLLLRNYWWGLCTILAGVLLARAGCTYDPKFNIVHNYCLVNARKRKINARLLLSVEIRAIPYVDNGDGWGGETRALRGDSVRGRGSGRGWGRGQIWVWVQTRVADGESIGSGISWHQEVRPTTAFGDARNCKADASLSVCFEIRATHYIRWGCLGTKQRTQVRLSEARARSGFFAMPWRPRTSWASKRFGAQASKCVEI